MRYFIAYTTIEGQTRKIAETIAATIEKGGDVALIMNASDMFEYTLEKPDGVILCAPIHAGRYPTPFTDFVHRESEWLNAVPSAFVSVTLSITSDDAAERQEAQDFARKLSNETGWEPRRVHHAAGALRYTEYDFFKRWMARSLAMRRGAPVDMSQNFELTDWGALSTFVDEFLKLTRRAG